jgi:lysocardiolipin and lysophospholipid acyltransferase
MSLTKQSFGLLVTTMTQWWTPTTVRISGDSSVSGQIRQRPDGRVEFSFPARLVMIANHQLYTDWLYLWWVAYANKPRQHGHLYIILKESLLWIPIIGQGIRFYGFIFMSRKMAVDKPRIAHRLAKLKEKHAGPMAGQDGLDPAWLLLFPEGTNLSFNGRTKSAAWAEKQGVEDLQHQLLPRSTGTFFVLNELRGTVAWVYDCTVAYEGIPRGKYGQDIFTLRSTFFEGRPPRSVNMYWRRFRVDELPLRDAGEFDAWLNEQWRIKDALLEGYMTTGRFPPSDDCPPSEDVSGGQRTMNGDVKGRGKEGYIETEVRQAHWWDFLQIFAVLAAFGLLANLGARVWNLAFYGRAVGGG